MSDAVEKALQSEEARIRKRLRGQARVSAVARAVMAEIVARLYVEDAAFRARFKEHINDILEE